MLFAVPQMVLCLAIAWLWLYVYFMGLGNIGKRKASKHALEQKEQDQTVARIIAAKYEELGSLSFHEATRS